MRQIFGPTELGFNRPKQCEASIEPALDQLLERAEQAGWPREETVSAIMALLMARRLADRDATAKRHAA